MGTAVPIANLFVLYTFYILQIHFYDHNKQTMNMKLSKVHQSALYWLVSHHWLREFPQFRNAALSVPVAEKLKARGFGVKYGSIAVLNHISKRKRSEKVSENAPLLAGAVESRKKTRGVPKGQLKTCSACKQKGHQKGSKKCSLS